MNDFLEMINEDEREVLETLQQLTKAFEEKGFDSEQLLKDIAVQIEDSEIPYQFPAVQRAWVVGKLLTKTNPKPKFTREFAYEILNYLKSFRSGKKAWHSGEVPHQKTEMGTYAHTLVAWKVVDDAEKAGVFTTFVSVSKGSQDTILSEFIENNSEYVSYYYYVASKWGLPVSSPVFDVYLTSLDELVEALREVCVTHNFHDVVEVIDDVFTSVRIDQH